jgi:hypothetical protein
MIDEAPVVYTDPFSDEIELMPIDMISAYVPFASFLHLEEAAKVAAIRDDEAAINLILSIVLDQRAAGYQRVITVPEGAGYDRLSVPLPY